MRCIVCFIVVLICCSALVRAETKSENFDHDPAGWEGFNNRLKPDELRTVEQDFGYSETNYAGGEKGELGGKIWRSATPASYAAKIPVKTLDDKLSASGKFVFTNATADAGLWFGWFNQGWREVGTARPKSALGLNLDFAGDGGRLSVRLVNDKERGCGSFVTPYLPGHFRPAPLVKNTQYAWTLTFDPQGASGNGRVEFTLKSINANAAHDATMTALAQDWKSYYEKSPESRNKMESGHYGRPDFEGKVISFDLPAGFKQGGASFDHFGLLNLAKEGRSAEVYFDDIEYDGRTENFAKDPQWEAMNNRGRIQETLRAGYHDFGFSADTHLAGGAPGEMGGIFWRLNKAYGYYADRVGPLTLNDPLEAHGKVMLKFGTPDCEMCFGWFNSSQKEPNQMRLRQVEGTGLRTDPRDSHLRKTDHFLGVYLTNSRGIVLRPAMVTARGSKVTQDNGAPRLDPRKTYEWSVKYDPSAEGGKGVLNVTLGGETARLVLDEKLRAEGASFDRFGFFPSGGGGMVNIYFDDLKYTAHQ